MWVCGLFCETFNIKDYIARRIWKYRSFTKEWRSFKVDKTFISHPTRAQHTLSAARTALMRYQQFVTRAYCGAAGPVYKMASQQEKAFCVFRLEVSRSVITVQREFRARLENTLFLCGASFLSRAWNSRCTAITDLDTTKRSTQKAFSYCYAIL
jgi:hypothetical protein